MQIKQIEDVHEISFDKYKKWLEEIAFKKKEMLTAQTKKVDYKNQIRKLQEEIHKLSSLAYTQEQIEKNIREQLIQALPSKF